MKLINPDIEVLGKYIGMNYKILVKHIPTGIRWEASASKLFRRETVAPKGYSAVSKKSRDFERRMLEINPSIIPLTKYTKAHEAVKCRCNICGHEWSVQATSLLSGSGCAICGRRSVTHEDFIARVNRQNKNFENIIILDRFTSYKVKISCKCAIDGHEWKASPAGLISGRGCPDCKRRNSGKNKKRLTNEEFIGRLHLENGDIELLSKYIKTDVKIKCRCLNSNCGHIWDARPTDLLSGSRCPKCKASRGEREIARVLSMLSVNFEREKQFEACRYKRKLPFDFFLPDYNTCIEFDGQQHYSPVQFNGVSEQTAIEKYKNTVLRDGIKTNFCDDSGISLLRISYLDLSKIETILSKFINTKEAEN